jgi:hypothetical protein
MMVGELESEVKGQRKRGRAEGEEELMNDEC